MHRREIACWGYSCPDKDEWSLNSDMVAEWHKPPRHEVSSMTYADFSTLPNSAGVVKNDSAQARYNTYGSGSGGVCSTVWEGESYWCSNTSSGGWAEVDFHAANLGALNLPVGLTINASAASRGHDLSRITRWANATGAVVAAWHSQTWFLNFFTVSSDSDPAAGVLRFSKGGSQGGRNWCRCDQCPYAANLWAGHQWCDTAAGDTRLIGGAWMVENVFEELDAPGEYFYNTTTKMLYLWPNGTTGEADDAPPPSSLVAPVLQTLVSIKGTAGKPATGITLSGLGFRDARPVYEETWGVPSGGDWAFHRSAAVQIEGATRVEVSNSSFRRLDGNAILLSGRTREVTILRNEFSYIAQNVLAGWGDTDGWDGTSGDQPRGTLVEGNLIREIGFFEKQSETSLRNNMGPDSTSLDPHTLEPHVTLLLRFVCFG